MPRPGTPPTSPPAAPAIALLTDSELARVAGQHVTNLVDHERRVAAERQGTSLPRTRRVGRGIQLGWLSIIETLTGAWRWLWNPRRLLGRRFVRLRLLSPSKTFSPWIILLAIFAGVMVSQRFWGLEAKTALFLWLIEPSAKATELLKTITSALAISSLVALLVLLWNDLFRLPFLAWRIRRRVIHRPESVLRSNLLARLGRPLIERLTIDIVPRTELYDDLLPGALARDRKDVQIVVGDAGAGKTTALLAVARLLAQNGIVSAFVPLRAQETSDIIELAKARFKRQIQASVRSDAEGDLLWRWLVLRRRVAVFVDDIDQVAPDGERGFEMRRMLDDAASSGLPVIVTARPAGVPAGVAASAIDLGSLDENDAIGHVMARAGKDPGFSAGSRLSRRSIEDWVTEGKLAEAPFYLELLAQLAAVGQCQGLPQPGSMTSPEDLGRVLRSADGEHRWNPLWVRFLLLEHFYEQTAIGRVRRSLGIEPRERHSTLHALEGAALGTLVATSLDARRKLNGADWNKPTIPIRQKIQEFIDTDDRRGLEAENEGRRRDVSAHEVIDAGERLGILESRTEGEPRFHHRIMQAYLAGRRLAERERMARKLLRTTPTNKTALSERDWIVELLDHRHPDKLTAHMTVTFAAMRAREIAEKREQGKDARPKDARKWNDVVERILGYLSAGADASRESPSDDLVTKNRNIQVALTREAVKMRSRMQSSAVATCDSTANGSLPPNLHGMALDPLYRLDPEARADPDDALMKLTTAAEIMSAVPPLPDATSMKYERPDVVKQVRETPGTTRWTKLRAIEALASLTSAKTKRKRSLATSAHDERWESIWEFARDTDYDVRRAASDALEENAYEAFKALADQIEDLIARAAARSSYGHWLMRPERFDQASIHPAGQTRLLPASLATNEKLHDITTWKIDRDIRALKALGSILPAIMSGFREDPSIELEAGGLETQGGVSTNGAGASESAKPVKPKTTYDVTCHPSSMHLDRLAFARRARRALESLIALAFEGGQGDLEAAVAQGFRSDALRHALYPDRRVTGPGWVSSNRELVASLCLDNAGFWYARMTLYQALALYAIAGANTQETLDIFARHLHRGGRDRHPFTQRVARLARAALRRHELRSDRWQAFLWSDEGKETGRRAPQLSRPAAQLLADVTVLLNLNESSAEDRQDAFVEMKKLPYCLSGSPDRMEILGGGCPSTCGWNLCPYRQPAPDEPNAHRGVRRAFCRQQREIALRRKPSWQRGIHRSKLREFWREMELRART